MYHPEQRKMGLGSRASKGRKAITGRREEQMFGKIMFAMTFRDNGPREDSE